MPVLDAKGISLYYEESGKGEPVVFTHGALCDYAVWKAQTDALATEYRTLAYSRRYAHPNERQGDTMDSTVQNNAEDLGSFIDGLGLGKVHLVGHSYGGFIAAYFAINHPDKLRSLTLANAAVATLLLPKPSAAASLSLLFKSPSVALSARRLVNATKATVEAVDGGDATAPSRMWLPALLNGRTDLPPKPQWFEQMVTRNARALRETTTSFPPVTMAEVKRIQVPTLVIWGALSAPWDLRVSEMLAQSIPGSESVVMPGTGHFFFVEDHAAANEKLLGFLRRHHAG